MKISGVSILLLIVLALIVLQSIGGFLQIKDYQKALKRIRPKGKVHDEHSRQGGAVRAGIFNPALR